MLDFKLGFLNIDNLDTQALNRAFETMNNERKAETIALVSENKRNQKIAADMLCRQMLADESGIDPQSIIFSKGKNGKPYAANCNSKFNISHCGNLVVCAVSKNEIGVDIERIRNIRLKAAEKFASTNELEYIGNSLERFFEIWTLKEAFFKCKGTGLGANIKNISFGFDAEHGITCSEKGYKLYFDNSFDGHICSVCIEE